MPPGWWRRSISLHSREGRIYLAILKRHLSLRQAAAEYAEEHHDPKMPEEVVPALRSDRVSEKPAKVEAVRIYHFHQYGTPAPSSGSGRMQYYRDSEAVQVFPKDKPDNVSGSRAEDLYRTAAYHATYVSRSEAGQLDEKYWGVLDQRSGEHYTVSIPSDDEQLYAVLVDFAEQRAAVQADASSGQDIAIFIG